MDFLGCGYILFFKLVKYAIYLLLTLFIGTGIFDILINYNGDFCYHSQS